MQFWERTTHYRESLHCLPRTLTLSTLSTGLVTFIMVLTVPFPVVYQAATAAGWTTVQTGSWLFAVMVAGGLMQLVLILGYRQPIAVGVSTVSAAFLVQALPGVSLAEAVGAYLLCGGCFILLACTGLFGRLLHAVPQEIVMGMLAGALLHFATGILQELVVTPLLVGPMVVAWLVAGRVQHRGVPPVAVALAVGVVLALLLHPHERGVFTLRLTWPVFFYPHFTLSACLSLAVPLVFLVLSQNAAGIGALWTHGYRPPVQAITLWTGVFTVLTALMGGQGVSVGAQRSAVAGDPSVHAYPDRRYGALVVDAVGVLAAAVLATTMIRLFALLPLSMIRVVAGLAMLPVVRQALASAVGEGRYRLGGFFALVIAASNVSLFGVSSLFWALLLAPLLSLVVERAPQPGG